MGRECNMHGRDDECIKEFGVKEGKRPLQRWKATIKTNLR
jgi:hypothetical protein